MMLKEGLIYIVCFSDHEEIVDAVVGMEDEF